MNNYVPITIPLTDGISEDQSGLDARRPGIQYANNVDFSTKGCLNCRPGYTETNVANVRTLDTTASLSSSLSQVNLTTTPNQIAGIFPYRDSRGERPGLLTRGRVYTFEDSLWQDRLFAGSSRVDRLVEYRQTINAAEAAQDQCAVAWNFFQNTTTSALDSNGVALLGESTPSVSGYLPGSKLRLFGGSCVTSTGIHCTVGNSGLDNDLWLVTRVGSSTVVTATKLRTDCLQEVNNTGAAPSCSTSTTAGDTIWILYKVTGGATYSLLRANASTGTVLLSGAAIALANIAGLWLSANLASTNNALSAAFTITGAAGVRCKSYNATTLVESVGLGATFDGTSVEFVGGPVVIGNVGDSRGIASPQFVAYATKQNGTFDRMTSVVVGTYVSSTPTATVLKTYSANGLSAPFCGWSIQHEPVTLFGNRTHLGLTYTTGDPLANGLFHSRATGTWFSIDITNLVNQTGEIRQYGTRGPGYYAMGPTQSTSAPWAPFSAIKVNNTYRFGSVDYKLFSADGAKRPTLGINNVKPITPQTTVAGEETIISGSVPHAIARGMAFEVGFPMVAPECSAVATAGGSLVVGTYSVVCVWAWTDEAGVVHRSAPSSIPAIATTAGANLTVTVTAHNCQLTEREIGQILIEVYTTDVTAPTGAPRYLVATSVPAAGRATTITFNSSTINTNLLLYSNSNTFVNTPVNGDGGVATVNRRVWMSDGSVVFASKLQRDPGLAPAWNDEGVLQVTPPTTAGKIVALQQLDDKLVILCERGIFITQGDGPDDTGSGPDFLFPVSISNLGVLSENSSTVTSKGIVFASSNISPTHLGYGGLYIIDRGLGVSPFGLTNQTGIRNSVAALLPPNQVTCVPEKDMVIVVEQDVIAMTDLRTGQSSYWQVQGNPTKFVTSAAGVLWAVHNTLDNDPLGVSVGSFIRSISSGFDFFDGGFLPYSMTFTTNAIYANGEDGLSWSRVRSVSILGNNRGDIPTSTTFTVTQDNNFEGVGSQVSIFSGIIDFPSAAGTWPITRYNPEYRLPFQKCSSLYVRVDISPACVEATALRLDIKPSNKRAPAIVRQ